MWFRERQFSENVNGRSRPPPVMACSITLPFNVGIERRAASSCASAPMTGSASFP